MQDSPGVQTMLGAAGACPEVIHNGKTWKIGHPTQRAKGTLETLIIQKASEETLSLKKVLAPEAYEEIFESFRRAVSAGEYKTGAEGWAKFIFKGKNANLFLLALLREHHPAATEKDAIDLAVAEPEQVQLALAQVVPGFFDLLLADLPLSPEQSAKVKEAVELAKQMLVPASHPSPGDAK